jgi:hypothetical protein
VSFQKFVTELLAGDSHMECGSSGSTASALPCGSMGNAASPCSCRIKEFRPKQAPAGRKGRQVAALQEDPALGHELLKRDASISFQ